MMLNSMFSYGHQGLHRLLYLYNRMFSFSDSFPLINLNQTATNYLSVRGATFFTIIATSKYLRGFKEGGGSPFFRTPQ